MEVVVDNQSKNKHGKIEGTQPKGYRLSATGNTHVTSPEDPLRDIHRWHPATCQLRWEQECRQRVVFCIYSRVIPSVLCIPPLRLLQNRCDVLTRPCSLHGKQTSSSSSLSSPLMQTNTGPEIKSLRYRVLSNISQTTNTTASGTNIF